MSQLFYESLPEWIRPPTRYSNRKELDFADPLRIQFVYETVEILYRGTQSWSDKVMKEILAVREQAA